LLYIVPGLAAPLLCPQGQKRKSNQNNSHKHKLAMRTSLKTFALAFAFVASTFAAQAEDKEAKRAVLGTGIYPTKAGKINVLVDKTNAESSTTLLLKNENGEIVYRETISKEQQKFGRTLNLDNMEAGQYKLEVISGKDIQSKTFQLSDQKVERTVMIK
jgi:hypothetical protein